MTVVVLTHWLDPTADHVVEELNRREVPVFRCDAADFPQRLSVGATLDCGSPGSRWAGVLSAGPRAVDLREVSGILYRRPSPFKMPRGMSGQHRRWAAEEARLGFGGLLASLGTWLNHPFATAAAEYKPVQLQSALEAGLTIPRTLITNDPQQARAFCEEVGEVIYKPLGAASVAEEGQPRTVYATRVPRADFGDRAIGHTAHLFQEWVEHDHAVRAVVVDGRFFTTAIRAHTDAAHTDWRSDYAALSYEPAELPRPVRSGISMLMSRLGLRFGALDLLVRPDGTHVFLEINPNGQWAWVEQTAAAIASAIADGLMRGPHCDDGRGHPRR